MAATRGLEAPKDADGEGVAEEGDGLKEEGMMKEWNGLKEGVKDGDELMEGVKREGV